MKQGCEDEEEQSTDKVSEELLRVSVCWKNNDPFLTFLKISA